MSDLDRQEPDEARPPMQASLEAPLNITEDTKQEMEDDDAWSDVYDNNDAVPAAPTSQVELVKAEPASHESSEMSAALLRGSEALSRNDDAGFTQAATSGDNLVAPMPPIEGADTPSTRMLEQTSEIVTQNDPSSIEATEITDATNTASIDVNDLDQLMTTSENDTGEKDSVEQAQDAEVAYDSSPYESSDDTDSDTESLAESDIEEVEDIETAVAELMAGPRSKNEIDEELVPKPDIMVTPEMSITLLGVVDNFMKTTVLIKAAGSGEERVLEPLSALCTKDRKIIGAVSETFGTTHAPRYAVTLATIEEIGALGLEIDSPVYYVDQHSTFVFTGPLIKMKGSDASNIYDEEVKEDELSFSDDEEEARYKKQKKLAMHAGRSGMSRHDFKNGMGLQPDQGRGGGRRPFSRGNDAPADNYGQGLSYDDEPGDDNYYKPLKRPDNLSQLMADGLPPRPPQNEFERGRGRGRGFRGRGGFENRGRGRGGHDNRGGRGRARGSFEQRSGDRGRGRGGTQPNNSQSYHAHRDDPTHGLPAQPEFLSRQPTQPSATQYQYNPPPQQPANQMYQFTGHATPHSSDMPAQQYQQQNYYPVQYPQANATNVTSSNSGYSYPSYSQPTQQPNTQTAATVHAQTYPSYTQQSQIGAMYGSAPTTNIHGYPSYAQHLQQYSQQAYPANNAQPQAYYTPNYQTQQAQQLQMPSRDVLEGIVKDLNVSRASDPD